MNRQKQDQAEQAQSAPDVVVQDYLDFMLRAATLPVEAPVLASLENVAQSAVHTESSVIATPVVLAPVEPAEVAAPIVADVVTPLPVKTLINDDASTPVLAPTTEIVVRNDKTTALSNGRPHWASGAFECLLFQVLGLKLGAALVELGGIARISDDLTPVFGQSNWFMGLLRWNGRNIKVIDTARLIMPERLQSLRESEHPKYEFVLLIEGTDWGLGIDSATESVNLRPDEVRWRVSKQTRPWLAGTALERMCAVLDLQTISTQLAEHERPN